MKKKLLTYITVLLNISFNSAQVGINETNPQATLDINGDLIVKTIPKLITQTEKMITINPSTSRIEYVDAPKSFLKGIGGTGFTILGTTLISGWNQISFPTLSFDENLDYNTTNQYFVAPLDGVYSVFVFVKMNSLASISSLGLGIFKNSSGVYSLLADETYESLNVSILGIGVSSPPTRSCQTLVKLVAGERIYFGIKTSNLSVFSDAQAQFTIYQVR